MSALHTAWSEWDLACPYLPIPLPPEPLQADPSKVEDTARIIADGESICAALGRALAERRRA